MSSLTAHTRLSTEELNAIAATIAAAGVEVAGPLAATLITGGRSNLTYRLTDGTSRWVMRTPPCVGRTPSAHDVAREWRVTKALAGTDVPVARAVTLEEDDSALGGPFAVWEFVDGASVQTRDELDSLDDATVDGIADALATTLAALHGVDHLAVGLERFGRPDGYAERQLRRWAGQWELAAADPDAFDADTRAAATALYDRLVNVVPQQRSTGIVHGDFRIDNTLLDLGHGSGFPRVAAIVDWELSTIGDPVADVAMTGAYGHPAFDLVHGRTTAATSPRFPDAAGLAERYEAAGGVRLHAWEFHLALAYYKIAMIAAGIDHRYRAGGAVGDGYDTAGGAVALFLQAGLDVLYPLPGQAL